MRRTEIPEIPGVLSAQQCRATAESIARAQEQSGAIPWSLVRTHRPVGPRRVRDGAVGAGLLEPARAAYRMEQVASNARMGPGRCSSASGSSRMPTATATSARTSPPGCGTTFCVTGDDGFARRMWPRSRRHRFRDRPSARRRRDLLGERTFGSHRRGPGDRYVSVYHSIRCAMALANYLGEPQPEWEVACGELGHALVAHPGSFTEKPHHSMDWYYPILGGALRGRAPSSGSRTGGRSLWSTDSVSVASTTGRG